MFVPVVFLLYLYMYIGVQQSMSYEHIGCFRNEGEFEWNARKSVITLPASAVEGCHTKCSTLNQTYFGVRRVRHNHHIIRCFCGDNLPRAVDETQCGFTGCPGVCGGGSGAAGHVVTIYSVCDRSRYGADCQLPCNCRNGGICQMSNGSCPVDAGCEPGWDGPACNRPLPHKIGCYELLEVGDAIQTVATVGNCQTICIENSYIYFAVVLSDNGTQCYCISDITFTSVFECPPVSLTNNMKSIAKIYTVCPLGNYGLDGEYKCDKQCNCPVNDPPQSGICTETNSEMECITCPVGLSGPLCSVDIDECMTTDHGCQHNCNNTFGSYDCQCEVGYTLADDLKLCDDIDECPTDVCSQNCSNTPGSYRCSCQGGYELDDDGHNCRDINECDLLPPLNNCTSVCANTEASFTCGCQDGYEASTNNTECIDIDECKEDKCGVTLDCNNTPGSYFCGPEQTNKGQSAGLIAGVVAVCVLVLLAATLVPFFLIRRRNSRNHDGKDVTGNVGNDEYINQMDMRMMTNGKTSASDDHYSTPPAKRANTVTCDTVGKVLSDDNNTLLRVSKLAEYVDQADFSSVLDRQYSLLPQGPIASWDVASNELLKGKNKLKDVLPYDESRVVLSLVEEDPLSDYINASHVQGYRPGDKFIACLGPRKSTVVDFWRMVWRERASLVVMLTKLVEDGRIKCVEYVPETSETYGDITVELLQEDQWPQFTKNTYKVSRGGETFEAVHLHYTAWPDHGVPTNPMGLMYFLHKARLSMIPEHTTIVHCSAGIGRTGTFIALDYLLKQADDTREVDVLACVNALRQQRVNMVQTSEQYLFIYRTLSEVFAVGNTTISLDQSSTDQHKPDRPPAMNIQYSLLEKYTRGSVSSNGDISPCNEYELGDVNLKQVFLKRPAKGEDGRIDAFYVDSFKRKDFFLSTEVPPAGKVQDFWRLVRDYECTLVVLIGTEGEPVPRFLPESSGSIVFGDEECVLRSTTVTESVTTYELTIISQKDDDHVYANYEEPITDSGQGGSKTKSGNIIRLMHVEVPKIRVNNLSIDDVQVVLSEVRAYQPSGGPVVVCCADGISLTGQFVVSHNVLEMMDCDQQVDVYTLVRAARESRPEFITSPAEYRAVCNIAKQSAARFNTYASIV